MKHQIVLIIGAGASKALHQQFALGNELIQQISERVTDRTSPKTPNLSKLLNDKGFNHTIRTSFVKHLDKYRHSSEYPSIDGFIDEVSSYPEFREIKDEFIQIAKFSILFHILGYEGELKRSLSNNLNSDFWIDEVAKFINNNSLLENPEFHSNSLKIITFNYDRNIEHLLYNHELFSEKKEQIKLFIEESITHVYGVIGDLIWQNEYNHFEFGEDNNKAEKIYNSKNAIDLMYIERLEKNIENNNASSWIHSPETKYVCAFGFNFDLINYRMLSLQNLGIVHTEFGESKLIANVYPLHDTQYENRRIMANRIRNIKHDAEIIYSTCSDFLKDVLTRN